MKEEEKQIWNAHQQRFAALSRERMAFNKAYAEKKEALDASYGEGNVPLSEQLKMAKDAEKTLANISHREHQEIGRYMKDIEDYDRRRNPSPEKQTVTKEPEPEKPALAGGSRFFNSLGYEKVKAQEAPDRSKDKSIDRDER